MKKAIYFLAAGMLLAACNTEEAYQRELEQIDSLQTVLKSYQELLDSLDTEEVNATVEHVDSQYNYLMKNYPDMDDRDFWINEVPQFGTIDKSLGRLEEHREEMREKLEYSEHQLTTLKNSIKDDKLTEEQVKEYMESEMRASDNLYFSFNKYIAPSRLALKMWHVNREPYDSIVNNLRASQKTTDTK